MPDHRDEMIERLCGHIYALLDKALSRMPSSWWHAKDAAQRDVAAARELLRQGQQKEEA